MANNYLDTEEEIIEPEYQTQTQNQTTPPASNNVGNVLSWVEKLGTLIAKNGIKNIMSTGLLLLLFGVVGYFLYNPTSIIERVEKIKENEHIELVKKRTEYDPIIKENLINLRAELNAERTFIFEAHNGGSNINGLPFLYMDMTYDEPINGIVKVMDEYVNVSQTRYALSNLIYYNNFWYGDIEEIKDIDLELYYRLQKQGAKKLAIISIYGKVGLSGALGVEFRDDDTPDYEMVKRTIYKYSNIIAPLIVNED